MARICSSAVPPTMLRRRWKDQRWRRPGRLWCLAARHRKTRILHAIHRRLATKKRLPPGVINDMAAMRLGLRGYQAEARNHART